MTRAADRRDTPPPDHRHDSRPGTAPGGEALAAELAASRSPGSLALPVAEAARWVNDEAPGMLGDDDFPTGDVPVWDLSAEWVEAAAEALALVGVVLRLTVCSPRATAGRIWTLYGTTAGRPFFRLTIGRAEVCVISWHHGEQRVKLRTAETPIAEAFRRGHLTAAELEEHGVIDRDDDMLRSPGPDQAHFLCPDVPSALWLVTRPAVTRAARLFNVRLATAVRATPYAKSHHPVLAAAAWHSAPELLKDCAGRPG